MSQILYFTDEANGWGSYESLVEFTEEYLAACLKYPLASIRRT